MGINKDISFVFDYSNKDYLTKKDLKDKSDYNTSTRNFHGRAYSQDKQNQEDAKKIHEFMKTTTYTVGQKGKNAPNEKLSSHQT